MYIEYYLEIKIHNYMIVVNTRHNLIKICPLLFQHPRAHSTIRSKLIWIKIQNIEILWNFGLVLSSVTSKFCSISSGIKIIKINRVSFDYRTLRKYKPHHSTVIQNTFFINRLHGKSWDVFKVEAFKTIEMDFMVFTKIISEKTLEQHDTTLWTVAG